MKLVINNNSDDPLASKGFSFSGKDTITDDGTAKNAMGGTELMRNALYKHVDNDLLDKFQIICSRVRYIDPSKPTILWLHDTYDDPESQKLKDPSFRKQFAKLVFVSYHQMQSYQLAHNISPDECCVIQNAIEPFEGDLIKSDSSFKMIYHTTPHRGLELLYPVFNFLYEKCESENIKLELDVFSSFKIYGWEERDKPYKELFKKLEEHPAINYHGFQPNNVVRDALKDTHFFAYPNIWPETSCIALMEAMAAGVACVCPAHGALPETATNFCTVYPMTTNPNINAQHNANIMWQLIQNYWSEPMQKNLHLQKIYANNFYTWPLRKLEWTALLKNILTNQ